LPAEPIIARCDHVSKTYRTGIGEVRALRDVSARFPAASLSVVAGPAGSGKSSLLRLLVGMDRPTSGTVQVANVDVSFARQSALRRLRRRTLGYLFQRPSDNFLPHLTLEEHLVSAVRRGRRDPIMPFDRLIELLSLQGRLEHLPGELSGGEQQRGAIAQVVMSGARLIVADEPTAQLDAASAGDVISVFGSLTDAGLAFVLASHDDAVMRVADELIRLDHGERVTGREPIGRGATPLPRSSARGEPIAPPLLRVEGVRKSYGRGTGLVHAVRDARFEVAAAEVVALVGRSGSGKTTLLNLVAGWERPDAGSVSIAGVRNARAPSWNDVAVLPQKLGLIDELTVRENIEYPVRLCGRLQDLASVILGLIDGLGLVELQDRYPAEISVGEQQRTALARALVLSPRLLLADEPSCHQDRGWTDEIFARIRRASDQGTACIAATHNVAIIRHLDRVLLMDDGELRERSA
jgi:putative ABC transport system ATP-binding protein